jgi:diguanylate cyclase (GGDEF)-like protein
MTSSSIANARLLIVDDNPDNRAILRRRLAARGFETVEAEDGAAALDMIGRQEFDLVLLDIMMPGIDGFQVLKGIRAKHSSDALPVIMVTASAFNKDIVEALGLGANDYVVKPVDFSVAFARVDTQLARRRAHKALARSLKELIEANSRLENEIAERKRSKARVRTMVHDDALTGLGHRVLFREQLVPSPGGGDERGGNQTPVFIDLDELKIVNDTLGHPVGDVLLRAVAERLRSCVQETEVVARMGGDEFGILQTALPNSDDASRLATKIAETIAAPYTINGHHIVLSCSIGIAMAPKLCSVVADL